MKVIEDKPRIRLMEGPWTPRSVIKEIVEGGDQEDPFYVMNVGEVVARYRHWKELMPRVEPFYAVKCNNDKLLLTTLAALGTGFDCASKNEIRLVTSLGVQPERIIFAHPVKMLSHIRYASAVGVDTMTFDSESELEKIKQQMPHANLVIRIRCDAASALCPLGIKFGCDPVTEAPRLLKLAAVMQLKVVGASFHVGSGIRECAVFARAIALCRPLFRGVVPGGWSCARPRRNVIGRSVGVHLLYCIRASLVTWAAEVVNTALEQHFPERSVRVIAEPGRYFAAAAYTLATMIHGKKEVAAKVENGSDGDIHTMYFINDGVYGSFNCVLNDPDKPVHAEPLYAPFDENSQECSLWGPSCDSVDCVKAITRLPPQREGAWLVFRDMGAYSLQVAVPFNGFPLPTVRHVIDKALWAVLKDLWPLTEARFIADAGASDVDTPPLLPSLLQDTTPPSNGS